MKAAGADVTLPRLPALWPGDPAQRTEAAPGFIEELSTESPEPGFAPVPADLMLPPGSAQPPVVLFLAQSGQRFLAAEHAISQAAASMPGVPDPSLATMQTDGPLGATGQVQTFASIIGGGQLDEAPLERGLGLPDQGAPAGIQAQPGSDSSSPSLTLDEPETLSASDPANPKNSARDRTQSLPASTAGFSGSGQFDASPTGSEITEARVWADLRAARQSPQEPPASGHELHLPSWGATGAASMPAVPDAPALPLTEPRAGISRSAPGGRPYSFVPEGVVTLALPMEQTQASGLPTALIGTSYQAEGLPTPLVGPAMPGTIEITVPTQSTYPGVQESALRSLWEMEPPSDSAGQLPPLSPPGKQESVHDAQVLIRSPSSQPEATETSVGRSDSVGQGFPVPGVDRPDNPKRTDHINSAGNGTAASLGVPELATDSGIGSGDQILHGIQAARDKPGADVGGSLFQPVKPDPRGSGAQQPGEPFSPPTEIAAPTEVQQGQNAGIQPISVPDLDIARAGAPALVLEPHLRPIPNGFSDTTVGQATRASINSQESPIPTPLRQASAALAHLPPGEPGRIELTLAPETLGRLHFDMRPEGTGLSITLSAERSETLDLMRRHLPELLAELKQAGVPAGTLSFGAWSDGRHKPRAEQAEPGFGSASEVDAPKVQPAPLTRPAVSVRGLDMRL